MLEYFYWKQYWTVPNEVKHNFCFCFYKTIPNKALGRIGLDYISLDYRSTAQEAKHSIENQVMFISRSHTDIKVNLLINSPSFVSFR